MSTIARRLAVLATLVALMAPPLVTAAAAPAAADEYASIAIETSTSGDAPVGQQITVAVSWEINYPVVGGPFPTTVVLSVPADFRVDDARGCVTSPTGSDTRIECNFEAYSPSSGGIGFLVTALRETYDATFYAAVYYPEVFDASTSLTIDSYVPGVSADVHPFAFDAPNPLVVGQSFTIAGRAANGGTTTMHGVTAIIDVAAPLQLNGATWGLSATPCTISGLRATCAIGTLFGHSSVPVTVSATPTAPAASTTATVKVTSTTPEQQPDPLPDTVTLTRPVKPAIADLGVAVNLPSTQPVIDAPTSASIVVTNHGTAAASGIVLSFTISAGNDFTLAGAANRWTCTQSVQTFTCVNGPSGSPTLAAGATKTLFFSVTPRSSTSGTLSASATTTSAEPNPDPTPNSATATLAAAAAASADLSLSRSYTNVGTLVVGTTTQTSFSVSNYGPSLARSARVVATYPSGWSISQTNPQSQCSFAQSTVTCDLGDIPPHDGVVIRVTATPSTAGASQQVEITGTSSTPDPGGPARTSVSYDVVDQPTLSVTAPDPVDEGQIARIALRLSLPTTKTVSVTCITGDWTATAGADYVQSTQTVTFTPGTTSAYLPVTTRQDSRDEQDVEAVLVACGNAVNAKPANPDPRFGLQWIAFLIRDDDPLPTVVPGAVSQREGAATTVSVPITLSAPSGRTVTAAWRTEDQTAKAGNDYTAKSGTVTFAPGETTKYVTVTVRNDAVREPDEGFLIRFTGATNATIGGFGGVGFVQILNDD